MGHLLRMFHFLWQDLCGCPLHYITNIRGVAKATPCLCATKVTVQIPSLLPQKHNIFNISSQNEHSFKFIVEAERGALCREAKRRTKTEKWRKL